MSFFPAVFSFLEKGSWSRVGVFLVVVGGVGYSKMEKSMRKSRPMVLRRSKEHAVDISVGGSPRAMSVLLQGNMKLLFLCGKNSPILTN